MQTIKLSEYAAYKNKNPRADATCTISQGFKKLEKLPFLFRSERVLQ